jgi:uncharacterized protein YndB with AHSA1/START domain
MATTQITADQDAVVSEIFIAAPPERVYRALIEREQALQWGSSTEFLLTKWEMDPRIGGAWTFVAKQRSGSGKYKHDLVHHGEITEFDPPRVLAYTWLASWHSNPLHQTTVRWELLPVSGGTQVKVTHSGLAPMPDDCKGYAQGWPGLVARIKAFVESNL